MRSAAGILMIAISTLIGFMLSIKYTERKKFYSDFYSFNKRYIECVSFSGDSLKKLLSENNSSGSDFYEYMQAFILDKTAVFKKKYLGADESAFLYEYAATLGRGDYETEKTKANVSLEKIKERKEKSVDDEKKYKPLLIKLGFLFGAIVFILLI